MNNSLDRKPIIPLSISPLFAFLTISIIYNFSDKIHGSNFSVYLNDQGISFTQIGFILGLIGGVGAFLDMPSGLIADRYGRKVTGCIGLLLYGGALYLFVVSPDFISIMAAGLLMGIGMSLFSGTFFAWLKTTANGDSSLLNKAATWSSTFQWLISAIAGGMAYFLISMDGAWTFIIGGTLLIIFSIIIFFFLPENYGERTLSFKVMTKDSLKLLLGKGSLRNIVFASLLADVSLYLFIVAWQPAWISFGNKEQTLGILFIFLMLAAAFGSFCADKIIGKGKPWYWFTVGSVIQSLGLALVGFSASNISLTLGLIMFELGLGLRFAGSFALYFKLIPEDKASTVISAISAVGSLMAFVTATSAGYFLDNFGIKISFFIGSIFSILACIVVFLTEYLVSYKQNKHTSKERSL